MATNQTSAAEEYFRNLDVRAMPRYTFGEASRYLGIPESTLRAWFVGMSYGKLPDQKWFTPFLVPSSPDLLCFYDISSAHVLLAMKKKGVSQEDLRWIVQVLRDDPRFDPRYPLLGRSFWLFGKKIVVKEIGKRLTLSRRGVQLGLRQVIDRFLSRLETDENKMPVRLSPLRTLRERGKGYIVIDPNLAGGRPVVKGTGIAAEIIFKRKKSGESEARLAKDYRISPRAVKEAIKYFPTRKAA
ncbi:MAG TPA: DUF433 domain-containing protein [Terriglobales bacterium]|nr:DUF433 domain-containing protein [Terriglobales bacterium]